ncbi:T9SS type A sorting domain-containing protein [Candidatus Desantisbacteria bacterium]|nr:T9SS type A sorting domain-containing protein [Candidatus Desantisbacteria bacterium]
MWDFGILRNNFGKQQQVYGSNAPRLSPELSAVKAEKATSGGIKLSFTHEGANIDDLRIRDTIYLKVNISNAENYLGGEVHLSFNPAVLQVVDANTDQDGIQIQPGDFPQAPVCLMNEADNLSGNIDYAVVVWQPEEIKDGSYLAGVPFRVIAQGASSKVGFDFDSEENRQTMFVERIGTTDQLPEVASEEMMISVPAVFNNLDNVLVYPNPVNGEEVTFGNLPNSQPIKLRIFNIAGELVYEDEQTSNPTTIKWGLKNKDKEYVTSGIYIYLLEYQGGSKKGKIGVIR